MTFRMDDTDQPHEKVVRESSLTRGYEMLGVEFHRLDSGEATSKKSSKKSSASRKMSAMEMDIRGTSTCSAMAFDLGPDLLSGPSASVSHPRTSTYRMGDVPSMSLKPLVVSKSSGMKVSKSTGALPSFSGKSQTRNDAYAWNVNPLMSTSNSPALWGAGPSRDMFSTRRGAF